MMLAPYTGFGDDANTSVKFGVLAKGRVAEWSGGQQRITTKKIAGGGVKYRITGRDPYTITLPLRFESTADLAALEALQGTTATLRYLYGITKPLHGTYEYRMGTAYLAIPGVRLLRVEDTEVFRNGACGASATFEVAAVTP